MFFDSKAEYFHSLTRKPSNPKIGKDFRSV
jgi:hypothetical protein